MRFRFESGRIKIPFPKNICFQDEVEAIVNIATQTGENTAAIETVKEETEEVKEAVQEVKEEQEWTNERFKWMWDAIYALQDRCTALEQQIADIQADEEAEEENIPGIHDNPAEEVEETEPQTVIEPTGEGENNKPKDRSMWRAII